MPSDHLAQDDNTEPSPPRHSHPARSHIHEDPRRRHAQLHRADGYWDGASRFTLYSYSGTFNVTNGQLTTINPSFPDPSIARNWSRNSATPPRTWSGWYAGGTASNPSLFEDFLRQRHLPTLTYQPTHEDPDRQRHLRDADERLSGHFVANFNITFPTPRAGHDRHLRLQALANRGWFDTTLPLSPSPSQSTPTAHSLDKVGRGVPAEPPVCRQTWCHDGSPARSEFTTPQSAQKTWRQSAASPLRE